MSVSFQGKYNKLYKKITVCTDVTKLMQWNYDPTFSLLNGKTKVGRGSVGTVVNIHEEDCHATMASALKLVACRLDASAQARGMPT